ncbi:hypothetical protein Hdeb2414_s0010g00340861 [Helianthus debilis subsp. tardiflorus]
MAKGCRRKRGEWFNIPANAIGIHLLRTLLTGIGMSNCLRSYGHGINDEDQNTAIVIL